MNELAAKINLAAFINNNQCFNIGRNLGIISPKMAGSWSNEHLVFNWFGKASEGPLEENILDLKTYR